MIHRGYEVYKRLTASHLLNSLWSCLLLSATLAMPLQAHAAGFSKAFAPNTIGPGSVSTLTFTIANNADVASPPPLSDLAFSDTLPGDVTIATPANASTDCTDAILSAPAGGTTIVFSGGRLAPSSTCSVTVNVTSSTPDVYTNVSGSLTGSDGDSGSATADLTVTSNLPGFSKSFSPSTVSVGQTSTLTFTIDNTGNESSLNRVTFSDTLPIGMVVATPANTATDCNTLVPPAITANPGSNSISFSAYGSGATPVVATGSNCSVTVDVTATVAGLLGNITDELNSGPESIGATQSSGKASAVLEVQRDFLTKAFTDDPIPPGGTGTLQFIITNHDRANGATAISFTDDLDATLPGLTAVLPPVPDPPCGAGSSLTGTSLLTLTGGNLPPEGSCTVSVTVQVPGAATAGSYVNTTSTVAATIGGIPSIKNAASDTLVVAPIPLLTKTFTDDPVVPGNNVTLEFTITNTDLSNVATDIAFSDNLSAALAGLVPSLPPTPNPPCGAGSQLLQHSDSFGAVWLDFTGGNLAAGGSCTFSLTLAVPSGISGGTYTNTTSLITATVAAATLTGPAASDDLHVASAPRLTKTFTDDPVAPGGTATLEFTLSYDANTIAGGTAIRFTDDLNATLAGLTAIGLPLNDICGTGSSLTGSASDTFLTFADGILAPDSSCTFSVTVQVPSATASGAYTNTTSSVTATASGKTATSSPASDDLYVAELTFSKAFTDDPVLPGGTVNLQFVINNVTTASGATNITFTDDLDATLTGLVATALPSTPCGAGSTISGTNVLTLSGGNLAAGVSCTFDVTLTVPSGAAHGEYSNTTSTLGADVGGNPVTISAATDKLAVVSILPTYTVSYDGNGNTGGSAPVDASSPYTVNTSVTVLDNTGGLVKTSYTFDGWNTLANGNGTAYAPAATFNIVANVTLYAQWAPQRTYSAPSATGSGTITASFTTSDPSCTFGPPPPQFIPVEGNAASPPAGSAPAGVVFPHGLFNFTITGCASPGSVVNFTITYPQPLTAGTQYWKYGPEPAPGNTSPHWYVLPATIIGNTATFSITDGGLGDDDLLANNTFVDAGGTGAPAAAGPVVPIPTLSGWGLALLFSLMVVTMAFISRRQ